ncbi:MAG: TetR/AcrR family transcriptional regulator [Chitinophagaceae bacterium]|nr:TetR/AcrR family transcriptional regulator [Chitinophagaceae bacterium]
MPVLSKSEKTKQFIIEKAAPLFNKKGYAGTSMNDIMVATGLAKGGVYGHFESKDEIAAAAFEFCLNKVRTNILLTINQHPTALGKLFSILDFYHNYTLKPTVEGGCPILNTAIDADDAYPFLKKKAKNALNEMLTALQQIIAMGIAKNEIKPSVNTRKASEMIFAQIEGGIMMAKVSDDVTLLNSVLDNLKIYIVTHLKI